MVVLTNELREQRRARAGQVGIVIAIASIAPGPHLDELTAAIRAQAQALEEPVEIIIIDNSGGPARSVRHAKVIREPSRGYASARNAAVHAALDREAEWLVFIDDDEVPGPQWLQSLLSCAQRYQADAVVGPVIARHPTATPSQLERHTAGADITTGTRLRKAYTGNLLISTAVLEPNAFDPYFETSGGEDAHFTLRVVDEGATLVHCAEALAYTDLDDADLDPARLRVKAFRSGQVFTRAESRLHPGPRQLRRIATSALRAGQHGITALAATSTGNRERAHSAHLDMLMSLGNIAGCCRFVPLRPWPATSAP